MSDSEETIFSLIIAGKIPSHKVFENEYVYAFLDINPLSRGHTLVIPKESAATMDVLSASSAASLGQCLPKICRGIMKITGAKNYNLIQNNGEAAGQTVHHLHFHIIPHYPDSEHSFVWVPQSIDHLDAAELSKAIYDELN
jgi:histidine triad (HIT) family protein